MPVAKRRVWQHVAVCTIRAACLTFAACGGHTARHVEARTAIHEDRLVQQLAEHCDAAPPALISSLPPPASARFDYDVVVYTAHPDDEAMYAAGTLAELARAGRRVAIVVLSHGEGGRLLTRTRDGAWVERAGVARAEVVRVRDLEMRRSAATLHADLAYLYAGASNADFGFTTSCAATLAAWGRDLRDGLGGMLQRIVADLRTRRPRVVLTLDPRDDPEGSAHGHHKALAVLVARAVELAADARSADARSAEAAHRIVELDTFAPEHGVFDFELRVDPTARLSALRAHASQFLPEELSGIGARLHERFVLRYQASPPPRGASWLEALAQP